MCVLLSTFFENPSRPDILWVHSLGKELKLIFDEVPEPGIFTCAWLMSSQVLTATALQGWSCYAHLTDQENKALGGSDLPTPDSTSLLCPCFPSSSSSSSSLLTILHIPAPFMACLIHTVALWDLSIPHLTPASPALLCLSLGSYHESQSSAKQTQSWFDGECNSLKGSYCYPHFKKWGSQDSEMNSNLPKITS